jgi:hypothetical protein
MALIEARDAATKTMVRLRGKITQKQSDILEARAKALGEPTDWVIGQLIDLLEKDNKQEERQRKPAKTERAGRVTHVNTPAELREALASRA